MITFCFTCKSSHNFCSLVFRRIGLWCQNWKPTSQKGSSFQFIQRKSFVSGFEFFWCFWQSERNILKTREANQWKENSSHKLQPKVHSGWNFFSSPKEKLLDKNFRSSMVHYITRTSMVHCVACYCCNIDLHTPVIARSQITT